MRTIQALKRASAPPLAWPAWPLLTILSVLFLGPLIAPLFQATGLPLVADSGALARDLLSRYICPTPAKSYIVAGFPMAVCARCWGATIGLWGAWLAARPIIAGSKGWLAGWLAGYLRLGWPVRLMLGALPFLLWVAEIDGWPTAPYWVLLVNGALAGFWSGLFFYSIWPGLLAGTRRADW